MTDEKYLGLKDSVSKDLLMKLIQGEILANEKMIDHLKAQNRMLRTKLALIFNNEMK